MDWQLVASYFTIKSTDILQCSFNWYKQLVLALIIAVITCRNLCHQDPASNVNDSIYYIVDPYQAPRSAPFRCVFKTDF